MAWPTAQDYSEAVQNPRLNFQDASLKTGQVELTPLGLPRPRSGNFATVYRMHCGQHNWAVRCFLRNVTDQQERYAAISEYFARLKRLGRIQLPYMVDFEFLEKGIKVNGQWYPILKMEWVEGELLDKFIEKQLPNSTTLRQLAERWVSMTQTLESAGIAHGDLQHGNILIVKGELKLIDYDGLFVSTLFGFSSNEVGHYNYQHPSRTGDDFRADIDRFSAWVIYIALISLSRDPNLWQRVGAGDEFILLRKEDFVKPDTSATLALLTQHNDAFIQSLVKKFKQLLRNPAQIPPLDKQTVIATTQRPVSNANQGTTTHTTSTSSDWLTDYLPQPRQKSSHPVQSPPISVKPTSQFVKQQKRGQSQSTSVPKTRGKKWLSSKLVFLWLLIVGLLIVGMIFLKSEMEKRELSEMEKRELRVCEKHFQANRLTTALACYKKVLKKYPSNAEALAGLEQIKAPYVNEIKQALAQGQLDEAEQMLVELEIKIKTYRYIDNGNGTVTHNKTGLIWLKNANCFGYQDWGTAMRSAAKLAHGQCGLLDDSKAGMWRLPTKDELMAMIDENYVNSDWSRPAISNAAGTGPWKEGDAFSGVQANVYWSSIYASYSDNALYVNLDYGSVYIYDGAGAKYVWPVRRRQ
ncbi:MAG TPA: DUF1566 domain-containing protein [Thiotrichaceae bacterium]|nr:DUF1566 domain-containing protein [Thiotrichaceae bacterium]